MNFNVCRINRVLCEGEGVAKVNWNGHPGPHTSPVKLVNNSEPLWKLTFFVNPSFPILVHNIGIPEGLNTAI